MALKTVTQIIDQGTKLELYFSTTQNVQIDKGSIKLRRAGDVIYLYDNSGSDSVIKKGTARIYTLNYASITAPLTGSAAELETEILAMLNTGGGSTEGLAKEVTLLEVLATDESILTLLTNAFNVPLDTRASEDTLLDVLTELQSISGFIDTPLSDLATEATLSNVESILANIETDQLENQVILDHIRDLAVADYIINFAENIFMVPIAESTIADFADAAEDAFPARSSAYAFKGLTMAYNAATLKLEGVLTYALTT